MNARVIKANDPELSSWVDVSQDSDFPIQNLPFGIFRSGSARAGVAIGEHVLDLSMVHHLGLLAHIGLPHETFSKNTLNEFFSLGKPTISAVRNRLSELLSQGNDELRGRGEVLSRRST
jgi:fumarylacetoacetase